MKNFLFVVSLKPIGSGAAGREMTAQMTEPFVINIRMIDLAVNYGLGGRNPLCAKQEN